jgi:hypothetical protein
MMRVLLLLAACLLPAASHAQSAQSVYKCKVDGKTSYADHPCPHGASKPLPPPVGISPSDTMGPQGGDARTLLELEKARIARDKAQAREDRSQAKLARTAQARRQKCNKLRLRHKWAEEDLARSAHGPKYEAARIRARRQTETLAVECPV